MTKLSDEEIIAKIKKIIDEVEDKQLLVELAKKLKEQLESE